MPNSACCGQSSLAWRAACGCRARARVIKHILRKDFKLLWPLVLLVTVLQFLLGWLSFRWGFFGEDLAARSLYPILGVSWYVGIVALIVAVVHQDAIPGVSQDWLIRPIARRDLLS